MKFLYSFHNSSIGRRDNQQNSDQDIKDENLRQRILAIVPERIPSRHRAFIRRFQRFQMIARISRRDKERFTLSKKQISRIEEIERKLEGVVK